MLLLRKIEHNRFSKFYLNFLILLWLIENTLYFIKFNGVKIVFDSQRYLDGAQNLDISQLFYAYSLFIKPFVEVDFLIGITLFQILLSGISFYIFLKYIQNIFPNPITLLYAGMLLLLPDLQQWNVYIHSESIFISLSLISIVYFFKNKRLELFILLSILTFIRPNGFIVLSAYLLFIVYSKFRLKSMLIYSIAFFVVLYIVAADIILKSVAFFPFQEHLTSGNVIQGYSELNIENLNSKEVFNNPKYSIQIVQNIIENPVFYIKLFSTRLLLFFSQCRPYYSIFHNVYLVLFTTVFSYFSLKNRLSNNYRIFLLTPIFIQTAIILIVGVDWDNRFFVIISPFMYYLSINGFDNWRKKFRNNI